MQVSHSYRSCNVFHLRCSIMLSRFLRNKLHGIPKMRKAVELPQSNEPLSKYADYLINCLPVQSYELWKDELVLNVHRDNLVDVMHFLKYHQQFKHLLDVIGIDYPDKEERFKLVYPLLSVHFNSRIQIATTATEVDMVPSITGIFKSANWFEREAYDMYGVIFSNHPDLRRILTDYGFVGYPLRKDFPLSGYTEVRYDEDRKMVVEEPLKMAQEHRNFEYSSAWDQTGDYKKSP
eukprot:NODE_821_length_3913_cov_1.262716.p1 type:complete len:235 gc:universal NODE_821_length_3913_cov_1.262716:1290-586(-)